MGKKFNFTYRDISPLLQILREKLLGREHTLHPRFPPALSPRTIPPADIPRGPEYKYSNQYYYKRTAYDSVKPPVVAPIAEGPSVCQDPTKKVEPDGLDPSTICFPYAPTPGRPWWWDGHCYYECVGDQPTGSVTCTPPEYPPTTSPPDTPPPPCLPRYEKYNPCPPAPDTKGKH